MLQLVHWSALTISGKNMHDDDDDDDRIGYFSNQVITFVMADVDEDMMVHVGAYT